MWEVPGTWTDSWSPRGWVFIFNGDLTSCTWQLYLSNFLLTGFCNVCSRDTIYAKASRILTISINSIAWSMKIISEKGFSGYITAQARFSKAIQFWGLSECLHIAQWHLCSNQKWHTLTSWRVHTNNIDGSRSNNVRFCKTLQSTIVPTPTASLSKNLYKSLIVICNNSDLHLKFHKSCFQPPLLLAHWAHVSALFDCSPVHEFNERYSIYSWTDLAKLIFSSIWLL